jgi:hypothetical protein
MSLHVLTWSLAHVQTHKLPVFARSQGRQEGSVMCSLMCKLDVQPDVLAQTGSDVCKEGVWCSSITRLPAV